MRKHLEHLRSLAAVTRVATVARVVAVAAVLMVAGMTGSCGADFEPGSRITSLRVMAVRAKDDKTFAHPGETVELEALWYDPLEKTRNSQWAWAICVNPSSSTVFGCIQKIASDVAKTQQPPAVSLGANLDVFKFKVPDDTLSGLPTEARRNSIIGVIAIACPGVLKISSPTEPSRGLPLRCLDDAGNELGLDGFIAGIKRIFIRETDRNHNPVPARVTFDGADWPSADVKEVSACDTSGNRFDRCSGEKHEVGIEVTTESFEHGTDEFGADFQEQLIAQYYSTEGLFEHDIRIAKDPNSAFAARSQSKGQTLKLWFVARDNRGGVVWEQRQVHVKN
ncbi:MAG: hypothetical protein NVSMB1_22400 [Polyangiales bacterium]